jgi:ABC-type dipeptide/oligopeptide/nickel transport system permease subunit
MRMIGVIGLSIILAFSFVSVLSPILIEILPKNKSEFPYAPPSSKNLLGTNDIGEDVLVELFEGTRTSLIIGFTAAVISTVVGVLVGTISGFYGGKIDEVIGLLVDVFLVIPALPLMIVLAAYLEPSIWNVILVIGLLWWPGTARVVRVRAMQIRESGFVETLRCLGASNTYIILRHIIPNTTEVALAKFILSVAHAILLESGLSFIGLGDPEHKSWGMMLHYAMKRGALLGDAWWCFVPAGFCISATAMGFMLLGMTIEERYERRGVGVE